MQKLLQNQLVRVVNECSRFIQSPNKASLLFFFLVLLFLPTQLGIHFWPDYAYVNGLRIDYLSPTIFLTDIFVIILFVLNSRKFFKAFKMWHVFGLVMLSIGIFFSESPLVGWYGLLKLIEFVFLGWYVAKNSGQAVKILQITLPIGIFVESFLAFWQFVLQHSVGGLWYFLGERTFSGSTPGIANVSLNGSLVLRPYATFPHPNVLGGFLLISLLFLGLFFKQQKQSARILYLLCFAVGTIALCFTLSRTVIVLGVLLTTGIAIHHFFKKSIRQKAQLVAIGISGLTVLFAALLPRFSGINLTGESLVLRERLLTAGWQIFLAHPFFGVGLNNFLIALPTIAPQLPIQPVHNIFLLVLAEMGIAGFLALLFFLFFSIRRVLRSTFEHPLRENTRIFATCSIFVFVCVGLVDHYFFTLQQGQLLAALIFGLAWTQKKF